MLLFVSAAAAGRTPIRLKAANKTANNPVFIQVDLSHVLAPEVHRVGGYLRWPAQVFPWPRHTIVIIHGPWLSLRSRQIQRRPSQGNISFFRLISRFARRAPEFWLNTA